MRHTRLVLIGMIGMFVMWCIGFRAPTSIAADGPLANANVSFGQWETDPLLDRLDANPGGGAGNNHQLIPEIATIKAGGAVNFIISGLHNVQVYGAGTQPTDISLAMPLPGLGGGIIDDANNRIYRGWNPNTVPNDFQRDRVETVQFTKPGTYLVICGVVNHFANDGMFGFVRVLPGK